MLFSIVHLVSFNNLVDQLNLKSFASILREVLPCINKPELCKILFLYDYLILD